MYLQFIGPYYGGMTSSDIWALNISFGKYMRKSWIEIKTQTEYQEEIRKSGHGCTEIRLRSLLFLIILLNCSI
jgi:hypothetical protein